MDIATRVWNHKWKIDPIVRSLIDTDFYKLLICQSIFRNKPDTNVVFSLINRSTKVRLADLIDEGELREQLDHVRTISLARGESTWLRGNTFYGKRQMFRPDFMEWFERMRLPDYHLEKRDGQYELTFEGRWPEVMLWEIPALAVLMELRSRAVLRDLGKFELEVLYARAMARLWEKIERLKKIDGLKIAMVGDLRFGRTVHSLTKLLLHFDVSLRFVSPEILRMPLKIMNEVRDAGVNARETHDVADVIENADVLYVTRVQKERFSDLAQYDEVKDHYVISPELMRQAKEKMIVMHPLPRVGEISTAVDKDPRAAYFRQVQNGMYIRMALLAAVLGKA